MVLGGPRGDPGYPRRVPVCAPSVCHLPQAQPRILLLPRQAPQSRPPPPRVCLSLDAGCFAPPLFRGPPPPHLTSGGQRWGPKRRLGRPREQWGVGVRGRDGVGEGDREKGTRPRRRRGVGAEREGRDSACACCPPPRAGEERPGGGTGRCSHSWRGGGGDGKRRASEQWDRKRWLRKEHVISPLEASWNQPRVVAPLSWRDLPPGLAVVCSASNHPSLDQAR
uniref:uncharacterized protein LOC118150142 n=1 Tax=Callithrix jacchus TaxID=9483 RepID=UPI0023DD10AB|nr:uncharacterized protein LOC118150142 [Callithrix jacchus]